jgi:hypothetical protein
LPSFAVTAIEDDHDSMGLGKDSPEAFVVVERRTRHDEEQILTSGGLGLPLVLTTLPKWVSGHRRAH